ncbi:MAG: glycosyltransferase family 1 protein [Gemmatimonadetes bacterium]|nr:glycosyltransferase family 1 protein [Gemmatimonadota bacterium]
MKGIHYVSMGDDSGYADAGRRVLRGLVAADVPVTWTPMVLGQAWGLGYEPFEGRGLDAPPDLAALCNRPLDVDTVILHTVPEYYPLWRDRLADRDREDRPLLIGYPVWETTALPEPWPELLEVVDGLLLPCEWNRDVFRASEVRVPIEVAPFPVLADARLPSPVERGDDPFRFYSINSWTVRKALDQLLHAYLRAFDADDRVELVLKTSREDFTRPRHPFVRRILGRASTATAVRTILETYPRPATVRLETRRTADGEIRRLHADNDCYVSLSHGEGWGFGAFDAASWGNPVITTGFGGSLMYLTPEEASLVAYELEPVDPANGSSYTPDQRWASADIDDAVERLRDVRAHAAAARARAAALADRIHGRFSPEVVTRDLLASIERLRAGRASRA